MRLRRHHGISGPASGSASWADRQSAAAELEAHAEEVGPDIDEHPALRVFGTRDEALRYLHARWVRLLGVAIDADLEADPGVFVEAAWAAWGRVGEAHPGLVAVLRHHADHPAVKAADERHRTRISSAAGCPPECLPSFDAHLSCDQAEYEGTRLLAVPG